MARPSDRPLLPSVLDRLLDDEPDVTSDPLWLRSQTPRDIREGVRRDLEMLLNTVTTRLDLLDPPPGAGVAGELADSVLTYGLPDLTHRALDDLDEQARLCTLIRRVVLRCEPRLKDVAVGVSRKVGGVERSVRLQIDATLHVDPLVEAVTFDTMVDATLGTFVVKAS